MPKTGIGLSIRVMETEDRVRGLCSTILVPERLVEVLEIVVVRVSAEREVRAMG